MTDARTAKPMNPWLAGLIGIVILFALTAMIDTALARGGDPDVQGGWSALIWLIAVAIGAYAAAKLSQRQTPGWAVAAAGLLGTIAYLYVRDRLGDPAPLWLALSVLGSPLLGARLGIGAARSARRD